MPLHWEWRRMDCGNHGTPQASSDYRQTDVPDVVLLPRRPWAIAAEHEALNEAVTLVDSLLGNTVRHRSSGADLLRAMSRARAANTAAEDIPPLTTEERRASMESIFLRSSLEDLCRRRSAHADFDATLVGSGRLRRQNALCARMHNRWRCRDDNDVPGTTGNDQTTGPSEMLKRQPRSSQQRLTMYDEPLIRSPRRAPRARLFRDHCREGVDNEEIPEKLAPVSSQPIIAEVPQIETPPLQKISSTSIKLESPTQSQVAVPEVEREQPQPEDLQDVIRNQLECPVCLDYLTPPIKQCANGHCVCSSCSPRLSHCATCRASFISTSNVVLENLVRSLCFPCRYRDAGCTEILKMEERPSHEEVCNFRPRKCPTMSCDWQGLPAELKPHITSTHQYHVMKIDEYRDFTFCVDRNDGVPTIVHDEQFVVFIDSEMFVFESHYDLWRSKFFAELRRVVGDTQLSDKRFVYDVELYARKRTVFLKLRNLVNDEVYRSAVAIKIDLDVFNHFISNGQYTLHMRIASVENDDE